MTKAVSKLERAEAAVRSIFPKAFCQGYAGRTFISFHIINDEDVLGIGDTVKGAWRAARLAARAAGKKRNRRPGARCEAGAVSGSRSAARRPSRSKP